MGNKGVEVGWVYFSVVGKSSQEKLGRKSATPLRVLGRKSRLAPVLS